MVKFKGKYTPLDLLKTKNLLKTIKEKIDKLKIRLKEMKKSLL